MTRKRRSLAALIDAEAAKENKPRPRRKRKHAYPTIGSRVRIGSRHGFVIAVAVSGDIAEAGTPICVKWNDGGRTWQSARSLQPSTRKPRPRE